MGRLLYAQLPGFYLWGSQHVDPHTNSSHTFFGERLASAGNWGMTLTHDPRSDKGRSAQVAWILIFLDETWISHHWRSAPLPHHQDLKTGVHGPIKRAGPPPFSLLPKNNPALVNGTKLHTRLNKAVSETTINRCTPVKVNHQSTHQANPNCWGLLLWAFPTLKGHSPEVNCKSAIPQTWPVFWQKSLARRS